LCSLRHIPPYWEGFSLVRLSESLIRLHQVHDGLWVWSFLGEEAIERRLIGGKVARMFLLTW
jgi:hypothetical protein